MYSHIFFDLDRTLWDFETNSNETLYELNHTYKLKELGVDSIEKFIFEYLIINEQMWTRYRNGLVDKETLRYQRFHQTLLKFDIDNADLTRNLGNDYTSIAPLKTNLVPYTIELLEYLNGKYKLHIITNGFEEVQHVKMKHSGIDKYFSEVITSERAGYKKPDYKIFEFSINLAKGTRENSLMIGDSLEADILGAREFGIHQVYFNPDSLEHDEDITYEIKELKELMNIL